MYILTCTLTQKVDETKFIQRGCHLMNCCKKCSFFFEYIDESYSLVEYWIGKFALISYELDKCLQIYEFKYCLSCYFFPIRFKFPIFLASIV